MIELYSDGACMPNPGRMSIGGVLVWNKHTKEYSAAIGNGTNQVAELKAIEHGLLLIKNYDIPIVVISDSQYSLNVLSEKWSAKKNTDVIDEIKRLISNFKDLKFKWVRGHNGDKYNERADELANSFFSNGYYL